MISIPVYRIPFASNKAKGRSAALLAAYALVDDADAALAAEYWTLSPDGYAKTYRRGVVVFMHHAIAGKPDGFDISHLNANKLDNRRRNLAVASRSENMLNPADGATRRNLSCGYRGVTRDDKGRQLAKPWRGKVQIDGRTYQTSRFATAEGAAEALDALRESLGVRVREFPEVGSVMKCNQRKQNGARCEKTAVTPEGTCYQHRKGFYRNFKAVSHA